MRWCPLLMITIVVGCDLVSKAELEDKLDAWCPDGSAPAADEICENGRDDDCDGTENDCTLDGTYSLTQADQTLAGATGDLLGWSVDASPDITGDGKPDVIVGAPGCTLLGMDGANYGLLASCDINGGGAYVFDDLTTASVNVSGATATFSAGADEAAGFSLSGGGDIDGDGYADLLVGAHGTGDSGVAYLIPGPVTGALGPADSAATLTRYDTVPEAYGDERFAEAVALGGDVNGDGLADLLVGDPAMLDPADDYSPLHAAWLLLGPVDGYHQRGDVGTVFSDDGDPTAAGWSVSASADLDGDGLDEAIIGAPAKVPADGQDGVGAVLLYQDPPSDAVVSLDDADATVWGTEEAQNAGTALATPGDVDGDGLADLLVGAWGYDGQALLITGPVPTTLLASEASATLEGETGLTGYAGTELGGGDVNGDGFGDLLVGAPAIDRVYLVLGPISGTLPLDRADAIVTASTGAWLGAGLDADQDLDGDGHGDVLIGAPGLASGHGLYLFFGGRM